MGNIANRSAITLIVAKIANTSAIIERNVRVCMYVRVRTHVVLCMNL